MITSFQWVLIAVLVDPGNGTPVDYAFIDYYRTKRECYIERNIQPPIPNVKFVCMKRDLT